MTELAHMLEEKQEFAFDRVDVFNTGSSPINSGYSGLKLTQFNDHRVPGDYISKYFQVEGHVWEHSQKEGIWAHSLRHFLPEPRDVLQPFLGNCCTGFGRQNTTQA